MNSGDPEQESVPAPEIHAIKYSTHEFEETNISSSDLNKWLDGNGTVWMNVDGCHTPQMMADLGRVLNLHELALEDASNFHQRAKVDDYDDYMFIVMRMVDSQNYCDTEQLSIFLGSNYVLTIQERPGGDCLNQVRERLRKRMGSLRNQGADYLVYAIVDAVVDEYFPVVERLGEQIEHLEDSILDGRRLRTGPMRIHRVKRHTQAIRRAVWPLRDALNILCRDTHPLISEHTRLYLRDCYDHSIRVLDLIETYRELCHDLMDIYLSTVNNRMNEVMKVLTIITALFIPPTLIAGIYGMNFDPDRSPWNMPELRWYFGYPTALLFMAIVSGLLAYYLHRRGWLAWNKNPRL